MKPFSLRILVAALLATTALPASAEDLLEVYHLAQQNDQTLAQVEASSRAVLEKRDQGTGQLLPTLNFNAAHFNVEQDIQQPSPAASNYDLDAYSVQLTQPIVRMSAIAAHKQGKAYAGQAETDLAIARGDLAIRVAQAYFDVLAAEDALGFARTEKSAIDGQRKLAERNFAVGAATVVDVHEARARYDLAVAQEVAAANDLQTRQEALVILTGARPGALARLVWRGSYVYPDPTDVDAWTRIAMERNPLIKSPEFAVKIADGELEKNRGAHYPTLDLVASHNYNKTGSIFTPSLFEYTTNQIGVQLQVPLYSGGITQSKVRESVARREQARAALELARRTVTRQTREAYLAATGNIARAQALEQALVSSRKALESTLIGYESGVRVGVDVLNAQRDLYRTERDLAQARYQYVLSMLRLKLAAGTLNETDLASINERLIYPTDRSP